MRQLRYSAAAAIVIAFAACSTTPGDGDGSGGASGGAPEASGGGSATDGDDGARTGGTLSGGGAGAPSGGASAGGAGGMGGWGGAARCGLDSYDYCEGRAQLADECPGWWLPEGRTREEYVTQCHEESGEALSRADPCFLYGAVECERDGCPLGFECFARALIAVDPTQGDEEQIDACYEDDDEDACHSWTRGRMAACWNKARACGVEELADCALWAMLLPEYRQEADACLDVPCEDFELCRATALGYQVD